MDYFQAEHDRHKKNEFWLTTAAVLCALTSGGIFTGLMLDALPEMSVSDENVVAKVGAAAWLGLVVSTVFVHGEGDLKRVHLDILRENQAAI